MSKYVVVVFPDESKAYDGSRAFTELHNEGNLTLYGLAVVGKSADGNVSVKKAQDEGPVGTAAGMLVGGMVGLLGGPAGLAIGVTGGALVGSISDLSDAGVGIDFIETVGAKMVPGTTAVVSEVEEYWMAPLDSKMEKLGGTVFRRTRADFEDERFAQEVKAWNDELDELNAEIEQSSGEMKAKLEAKKNAVRTHLKEAADKARNKIAQLEKESHVKVTELQKQAALAKKEAKAKIEKRIEEVRAGSEVRLAKLNEAGGLIKEAFTA